MTVRCAVHGCKSGLVSDKQQKIRAGLRPATLFTVPKTAALLNQWSIALHQELHHNEKVCELHFVEKDVIKSDDTVMPDGSIFSLPRNKYILRKNAVPRDIFSQDKIVEKEQPSINQNLQCKVITETITEGKCLTIEQLPSSELQTNITLMDVEEVLIHNDINNSENSLQNGSPNIEISSDDSDTNEHILNDHQYFIDKSKPDQYYYFNSRVAAMFTIPSLNNVFHKQERKKVIKQVPETEENIKTIPLQDKNTKNKVTSLEELSPSPQVSCETATKVTIENMKDYLLKNPLLKAWSWMNFTSIDSGITFTQIDCTTKKIRCFVQLHEDMTISIQTGDEEVCMEMKYEITSPEAILKLLETVERIKLCNGAETGSRDKYCTGVISEDECKVAPQFRRCEACQRLRLQFRNRIEYTSHLKTKYYQLKKELNLLRQKRNNLKK